MSEPALSRASLPFRSSLCINMTDLQSDVSTANRFVTYTLEKSHDTEAMIQPLIDLINHISLLGDYRKIVKKECANLTRRVKLLAPLFEDVKELRGGFPPKAIASFDSLYKSLQSVKELLSFCHDGSKIYLVLEKEAVISRFIAVTAELEQALSGLPYYSLDLSDEVREQIELVHAQLKRAKGGTSIQDMELFDDLAIVLSENMDSEVACISLERLSLERLAEKLELRTVTQLKEESRALNQIFSGKHEEKNDNFEQMFILLRKLRGATSSDAVYLDTIDKEKSANVDGTNTEKMDSPIIPDDFRCPISLELMRDPVIVATGQTYERSCIQKWLDAGNKTCPKTQQVLPHLILTPNYVLRSLIAQWCETHGIELPRKMVSNKSSQIPGPRQISAGDHQTVEILLQNLSSRQPDAQRAAAGELRFLAKRNAENRVCIAEAGAIPLLVGLLSTQDMRTQEHAVTALLNLSIHDNNKGAIVVAGAIDPIVEVLKNGSMEARENAAATLFSLSVVDENKVAIGASGAVPALVSLLQEGTLRGRKDAATALFNLCIYQGNKARAVRAGVVLPLMQLLIDPGAEMVDEALAILAILATHQEGRVAISNTSALPVLVALIRSGSPRNKENAASILFSLCTNDPSHISTARNLGAYFPLSELALNGTTRARRKATLLLDHMNKQEQTAMR